MLDRTAEETRLRSAQKAWLVTRNSCTSVACVRQRYEQRIAEFSCDPKSRMAGSAIGSNQCSYYSLRNLEPELAALEDEYGRKVSAQSNNPEYTQRTFQAERKAWLEYRNAQCAFYGATEGGSDGWKNAFSGICAVGETKKRIAYFKKENLSR